MTVAVLNNQKIIDLCMQEYGDVETLFDVAQAAEKSITDELTGLYELELPELETKALAKSISTVLKKDYNKPASEDDSTGASDILASLISDVALTVKDRTLTPVFNNQRLIDLCMQEYGDVEKLFDVALLVEKGITDELAGVEELQMPVLSLSQGSKSVSLLLKQMFNNPASADDNATDITLPPGGIGFMQIENTFIVS